MKLKLSILATIFVYSSSYSQSDVQKTANTLNKNANETNNAINGAQNNINAAKELGNLGKSLGIGAGKKKEKKKEKTDGQQVATANQLSNTPEAGPVATSITIITFDKIDFKKMKMIKDSLATQKKVISAKTSFGTADGNFIKVEHTTDSDELVSFIIEKWPNDFTIVSLAEDKISLNAR